MPKPYTYRLEAIRNPSLVVLIADGDLIIDTNPSYPHTFIGVIYFNDADGLTPVTPSSGTAVITIKTINQPQGFQEIPNGTLKAKDTVQTDWSANTQQVKIEFQNIVGALYAQVVLSGNTS